MGHGSAIGQTSVDAVGLDEVTILIVDDHRSFADLLSAALNTVPGLHCIGTASSAFEGVAMAAELRPTIVIMDIQMPGEDGLLATRRIRESNPDAVIAVVTAHRDREWVSRAASAGAAAFIPKDGSFAEMVEVLKRAQSGQMLVAPSTFLGGPSRIDSASKATPIPAKRELQVLSYRGQRNHATGIARILGIGLNTGRGYLRSMRSNFGTTNQLAAVLKAQNPGLIGPPDEG